MRVSRLVLAGLLGLCLNAPTSAEHKHSITKCFSLNPNADAIPHAPHLHALPLTTAATHDACARACLASDQCIGYSTGNAMDSSCVVYMHLGRHVLPGERGGKEWEREVYVKEKECFAEAPFLNLSGWDDSDDSDDSAPWNPVTPPSDNWPGGDSPDSPPNNGGDGGNGPYGPPPPRPKPWNLNEYESRLWETIIDPRTQSVALDDIVGLRRVKAALHDNVILPILNPDIFVGPLLQPAKGILLFGPPGNGKTFIAKAVAKMAGTSKYGYAFMNIKAADVGSKWVGESENLMKAVFTLAKKVQPVIIFFDEIDGLLKKRGGDDEHEAVRKVKTEFLAGLDGMSSKEGDRIVALGASNRPMDLDDAALRRFPERYMVGMPGKKARRQIVDSLLKDTKIKHTITEADLEWFIEHTERYSASDLTNALKDAAMQPLDEFAEKVLDDDLKPAGKIELRPVNRKDLEDCLEHVKPSVSERDMADVKKWNEKFGAFEADDDENFQVSGDGDGFKLTPTQKMVMGLMEGFGMNVQGMQKCVGDSQAVNEKLKAVFELLQSTKKTDKIKGLKELALLVETDILPLIKTCKSTKEDADRIRAVLDLIQDPKTAIAVVGKNLMVNHKDVSDNIKIAIGARKAGDHQAMGRAIGRVLRTLTDNNPPGPKYSKKRGEGFLWS